AADERPPQGLLHPDDISELIRQHAAGGRSRPREQPAGGGSKAADALLNQIEANLAAAVQPDLPGSSPLPQLESASPFAFSAFDLPAGDGGPRLGLDTLDDVELDVRIELGRAELLIEDVLKLREGSVVPLDKLAGDPVDILVNGRLIARGEVLVLNDNFCVRVAEILNADP
ncbi:MAG TPA: flagellar motor switch protein FliN, partial [Planctomycetaceae bacterium]|nr:flagellar motor switch protein FliN [Planctomycetaceae bacterium]